jgi:two-component system, NarL family, nitrate/nitrite response regulator NarL
MELLTCRAREIAALIAQGLSNKEICRRLGVSEGTVKIHLHNAYQKLGIGNRTKLAAMALQAR